MPAIKDENISEVKRLLQIARDFVLEPLRAKEVADTIARAMLLCDGKYAISKHLHSARVELTWGSSAPFGGSSNKAAEFIEKAAATIIEYHIQGNYGAYGWETEAIEDTWKEGKAQLRCYELNSCYPSRMVNKRYKLEKES